MNFKIGKYFQGKEAWNSLTKFIGIGLYTLIFVTFIIAPQYVGYIFLAAIFVLPIYGYAFKTKMLNILKSRKNTKTIEGTTTHGYKKGEDHFLEIERIEVEDKLSPVALADVNAFINIQIKHSKSLQTTNGFEKAKRLSYKEVVKKEELNEEEKIKYENEEKEDRLKSEKEFNEIYEKDQLNKIKEEDDQTHE